MIPTTPSLDEDESLSDPVVLDRITPSHTWDASKRAIPPTTLTLNAIIQPRGAPPEWAAEADQWLSKNFRPGFYGRS